MNYMICKQHHLSANEFNELKKQEKIFIHLNYFAAFVSAIKKKGRLIAG